MEIDRAYKFRVYPKKSQQIFLEKTFGCCRFIWNQMLHERTSTYQHFKVNKKTIYPHKFKTEKQYKLKYQFLKEVDSKALQSSTRYLIFAFQNFFRGLQMKRDVGYPKFKSRKSRQSYTTYNIKNNIKINFQSRQIKLPKLKTWIKYRDPRIFSEDIKHITVSKTKSGKFFISIHFKREMDNPPKQLVHKEKVQAFDMSFPHFLVSSKKTMKNPRFYRNKEKKLKTLHRLLSRKKLGSNNWNKARIRLARKYEHIYNQKKDWTHKLCYQFSKTYDVIILEDLNIAGMKKIGKGHAKSVTLDFSWNQFVSTLRYKLEQQGKYLILVDRWFPSSKLCAHCGWKNKDLKIHEQVWICKKCNAIINRDKNASQNLLKEGLKILKTKKINVYSTVGTTGSHAWGNDGRLSLKAIVNEPRNLFH